MRWPAVLLIIVMAVGCEPDSSPPESPATTSSSANQPARQTAAQVPLPARQDRKWGLEIEGQPELAGDSVERRQTQDGRQTVSFFGQAAAIRLDLDPSNGVEKFVAQFNGPNVSCIYDHAEAPGATWKLDVVENHTTFRGTAACGAIGGPAERETSVKGWFDAELVRPRRPPNSEVTGAYGKVIPSLPPDNEPK